MKKTFTVILLGTLIAGCTGYRPGPINSELLKTFEDQNVPPTAPLSADFWDSCVDDGVLEAADTVMTWRVPTRGITDQKKSGRCWYFSTTNILRSEYINRVHPEGDFYYSWTYGQFYDILEKSNRFLENVIEYRRQPIDSRMNDWLFKKPFGDGGHWSNAVNLIEKYGLVPLEAMPERYASTDNATLMGLVRTLNRKWGLALRECSRKECQAVKENALADIYRILVLHLGTPPRSFIWQGREWTPQEFRDSTIFHDLRNDYTVLMNDPALPYWKVYEIRDSRNCVEYAPWRYLNVPMETINTAGVASLKAGHMFYISADTGKEGLAEAGVYDTRLFRALELSGIDFSMDKKALFQSQEATSLHAVAVAGVRADSAGEPLSWLIENSFGTVRGWDGFVVMSREWMDKYLFRMVVLNEFLPEEVVKMAKSKPKELPSWHGGY